MKINKFDIRILIVAMRYKKIALIDLFDVVVAKFRWYSQGVRSRKRKLIELYSVATSAKPLHQLRAPLDGPHSPALTFFLQQNDIEQ